MIKINDTGNRIDIDFGGNPDSWVYADADIEIGLSDHRITSIGIEFKTRLAREAHESLTQAIENIENEQIVPCKIIHTRNFTVKERSHESEKFRKESTVMVCIKALSL